MTSPLSPTQPPATAGSERAAAARAWLERRSFAGDAYTLADLLALKRERITVILPAREVAGTLGAVLERLMPLGEAGLLDEIVVVDAASADGTAEVGADRGARVLQESELMPEFGPALGKGDAMWRGLAATRGDIVVYLDADTEDFDERFVLGLLGPLLSHPELRLVKGTFRRPFRVGDQRTPEGGGRVTELVARPLLNLYVPDLAGFGQPLAGEVAARRPLLESLAFPVGYGVEIAMMIDSFRIVGVDAMAQADLGERQNRHQSLRALSAMAYAVLATGLGRVHGRDHVESYSPGSLALPLAGDELELREIALDERPPLRELRRTDRAQARPASR